MGGLSIYGPICAWGFRQAPGACFGRAEIFDGGAVAGLGRPRRMEDPYAIMIGEQNRESMERCENGYWLRRNYTGSNRNFGRDVVLRRRRRGDFDWEEHSLHAGK